MTLFLSVLIHCNTNAIKKFKGAGLYVESPDWIKNKKATINPINEKIINVFNTLLNRIKS